MQIYTCPKCGKIEFFNANNEIEEEGVDRLPQNKCPKCGKMHDFDYPKCPYCKYKYFE